MKDFLIEMSARLVGMALAILIGFGFFYLLMRLWIAMVSA